MGTEHTLEHRWRRQIYRETYQGLFVVLRQLVRNPSHA